MWWNFLGNLAHQLVNFSDEVVNGVDEFEVVVNRWFEMIESHNLENHVKLGTWVQELIDPVAVTLVNFESQLFDGNGVKVICSPIENLGLLVHVTFEISFVHDARKHLTVSLIKNLRHHWHVGRHNVDVLDSRPVDARGVKVNEIQPNDVSHLLEKHIGLEAKVNGEDVVGPLNKV